MAFSQAGAASGGGMILALFFFLVSSVTYVMMTIPLPQYDNFATKKNQVGQKCVNVSESPPPPPPPPLSDLFQSWRSAQQGIFCHFAPNPPPPSANTLAPPLFTSNHILHIEKRRENSGGSRRRCNRHAPPLRFDRLDGFPSRFVLECFKIRLRLHEDPKASMAL